METALNRNAIHKKESAKEGAEAVEAQVEQGISEAEITAQTRTDLGKLEAAINRTEKFAKWMDKRYIDPILGLIPGIGEIPTAALGMYIVAEALRAGVPKWKITRMCLNIGIDAALGAIPVVGDIFDFFYKSNSKNAAIFREYFEKVKTGG